MNGSIWKFPLAVTDHQFVEMPAASRILCVQAQRGVPCLWAVVYVSQPLVRRSVFTYGTGRPFDMRHPWPEYVGSYQLNGGDLVFHVFDNGESATPEAH